MVFLPKRETSVGTFFGQYNEAWGEKQPANNGKDQPEDA
jgi:hypothetical protein